jgi:hypothetical protein
VGCGDGVVGEDAVRHLALDWHGHCMTIHHPQPEAGMVRAIIGMTIATVAGVLVFSRWMDRPTL